MHAIIFLAVCEPVCENGGTCTAPNTCDCTDGYSGDTCQTGNSYITRVGRLYVGMALTRPLSSKPPRNPEHSSYKPFLDT